MNLKTIYNIYKEHIDADPKSEKKKKKSSKHHKTLSVIADAQRSIVQSHYPEDCAPISVNTEGNENENLIQKDQPLQPVKMKSIEPDLNKIELDVNRIIEPNSGLNGMYEFVPATQLKGIIRSKKGYNIANIYIYIYIYVNINIIIINTLCAILYEYLFSIRYGRLDIGITTL
jgi:hypothetical protein